jgi:hypothetical protein
MEVFWCCRGRRSVILWCTEKPTRLSTVAFSGIVRRVHERGPVVREQDCVRQPCRLELDPTGKEEGSYCGRR